MAEVKQYTLDEVEEDVQEFSEEFPYRHRTAEGKEVNATIVVNFVTPTPDQCKVFAEVRQGEITKKGRIKKLPNDFELATAAVNACVPLVRTWKLTKLWSLIKRTGGVSSDDGLVSFCYDQLGYDREADSVIGEGPTAEDYPSSSLSTLDDDSAQ